MNLVAYNIKPAKISLYFCRLLTKLRNKCAAYGIDISNTSYISSVYVLNEFDNINCIYYHNNICINGNSHKVFKQSECIDLGNKILVFSKVDVNWMCIYRELDCLLFEDSERQIIKTYNKQQRKMAIALMYYRKVYSSFIDVFEEDL